MVSPMQQARPHLEEAVRLLTLELIHRHGAADFYALCDCHSLAMDALSQLRAALVEADDERIVA